MKKIHNLKLCLILIVRAIYMCRSYYRQEQVQLCHEDPKATVFDVFYYATQSDALAMAGSSRRCIGDVAEALPQQQQREQIQKKGFQTVFLEKSSQRGFLSIFHKVNIFFETEFSPINLE